MKNGVRIVMIVFFSLLLLCFFGCGAPDDADKDQNVSVAGYSKTETEFLEKLFNKKCTDITEDDFNRITRLNIVGEHITADNYDLSIGFDSKGYSFNNKRYNYISSCGNDLSFLSKFQNLTELGIYFTPALNDISYISDMQKLTSLTLVMTNVSDLSFVKNLHELRALYVEASPVKKVDIDNHNHLDKVHFLNTNLSNLDFLSTCIHLHTLAISFNKIPLQNTDIISSLNHLSYLDIAAPQTDFSFLSAVSAPLNTLRVGGDSEFDLKLSATIRNNLTTFIVVSSKYVDLTPLDNCEKLKNISIFDVDTIKTGTKVNQQDVNYYSSDVSLNLFSWWENEK